MKTTTIHIILLIIAGFAVYANTLHNDFIWDDEVLIQRNAYLRNWTYLKQIFTTTAFRGGSEGGHFYRPLQILSYRIDYIFWQLNPLGYHLTNILFHLANCLIIYFIINILSGKKIIGFISALLFAVHPANTEAVAYAAGRADLIFAFSVLFSFLFYLQFTKSKSKFYLSLSLLCYLLSLFCKESALIFPILILFYSYCLQKNNKIRRLDFTLFLSLALAYIVFRLAFLKLPQATTLSLIYTTSYLERILTAISSFGKYILILLFPINLHMERHFITTSLLDINFITGIICVCLFIWFMITTRKKQILIFFLLGWFLINLLPILNLLFPLNASMAEHWLYLAAFGFIAAIVISLNTLTTLPKTNKGYRLFAVRTPFLIILAVCYLIYFSGKTVIRNSQWKNSITLFQHDIQYSPNSFLLHNNLGVAYTRLPDLEKAGQEFAKAVAIQPNYGIAHNNLGVFYERKKLYNKAIKEYLDAIRLNAYVLAYENLGRLYIKLNRPKDAVTVLADGCLQHPLSIDMHYFLGMAYYNLGMINSAKQEFGIVIKVNPRHRDIQTIWKQINS